MTEISDNFVQAGDTVECGHCHPGKFAMPPEGMTCECNCHKGDHDALTEMKKLPFYGRLTLTEIEAFSFFLKAYESYLSARHKGELESIAESIEALPDTEFEMEPTEYCQVKGLSRRSDAAAIVRARINK